MKISWGIAISFLVLFLSMPVMAAKDGLSITSKRLKITVSKDIKAASEKVEVIKDYKVLSRLESELTGYLEGLPAGARTEIVITGFRLRSGASGFFGMSGRDEIDARVTVKDKKKKQIAYFTLSATNGRSGKSQPPTRRLVTLVQKFGQKFGTKLNMSMGKLPFFPGVIKIYPR